MTNFFIQPKTPRPDFRVVIAFLWGDWENVDTEGNAANPASREWTELYGANRGRPQEIFDVEPIAAQPLTLRVTSELSEIAARVAYFLAVETESLVAAGKAGPWQDPSWLADKVGAFDLAEATERAARSHWRQATLDNPYPASFKPPR
jgi:hypothetical protein